MTLVLNVQLESPPEGMQISGRTGKSPLAGSRSNGPLPVILARERCHVKWGATEGGSRRAIFPPRMTGQLITFEGVDGSGKTTQLQRAAEWLAARGVPCQVTKEPGGTPLGESLRGIFLDPRWGQVDGTVELLLIFASRRQHLLEVIEPALAAGRTVLCDRFTDSTRAYQGYGRGVPLAVIEQVDLLATGGRVPDHTLLFDLPPEQARQRGAAPRRKASHAADRADRGDRPDRGDRLDAEDLAFYQRVREGFLALAAAAPERFHVIDSSGAPGATFAQVQRVLQVLLGREVPA